MLMGVAVLLVGLYAWRRVLRRGFKMGGASSGISGIGSRARGHRDGTSHFFRMNEKGERGEGGFFAGGGGGNGAKAD